MQCYERGDYQGDNERDSQLEQQAFRLQSYVRALRGKLEREKASLASLRDETRTLLAHSNSSHLPDCPVARRRLLALQDLYVGPAASQLYQEPRREQIYQQPRREQVYKETCREQGSYLPNQLVYHDAGDVQRGADTASQRGIILQKLTELDLLCKQEMMRIHEVGTKLEPFKQLANDWNFQAEVSKKYPKADNISKVKVLNDDNIPVNNETTMAQKCVSDIEKIVSEEVSGQSLISQEHRRQENVIEGKANEVTENPKESLPIEVESKEKETNETVEVEEPSGGGVEAQREEVEDSGEGKRCEVAPISWRRLLVDKKKRTLKSRRWTDCSSEGSSSSSSSQCAEPLVEETFLQKYMYSDSEYVYSPLFVTESEDTD